LKGDVGILRTRLGWLTLLALPLFASIAPAAALGPGGSSDFKVELPREVRELAGRGQLSPVTQALVTIAVPENFDAAHDWPVLVVNSTSEPGYRSSRRLLRAYADEALRRGWILIAADPLEELSFEQDEVALRYALNKAGLAALQSQWPGADKAPLAFGGFSAGAKYSGSLAAAFASEGRSVIGIYLAGINEDTVASAARQFNVLSEAYRRVPVFLQSGETDEIATMADHRRVADALKHAGFRNVRIEYFPGPHAVEPRLLPKALDWFLEVSPQPELEAPRPLR
jgi:predicted esterase